LFLIQTERGRERERARGGGGRGEKAIPEDSIVLDAIWQDVSVTTALRSAREM